MIFSAKLEFYLKWSLVPLSVIGMKPSENENENMSNSRNLFCMVANCIIQICKLRYYLESLKPVDID